MFLSWIQLKSALSKNEVMIVLGPLGLTDQTYFSEGNYNLPWCIENTWS